MRVGLLGGSFNPAHEGHLHISRLALAALNLDQVWWLVSPQNVLKPTAGMARFEERVESARRLINDPRIRISLFEAGRRSRYTIDTVRALKRRFPKIRFVWLMGADNLLQFPHWKLWQQIFNALPIAVFARPTYSHRALSGQAAHRFRRYRRRREGVAVLAGQEPPAWAFLHLRESPLSATDLRLNRHSGRRRTP
jgi:nicotinate-nucleotide adenylyltransferase